MKTAALLPLAALILMLGSLAAARAADMEYELNCATDSKLLDTHFARYGHAPNRAIVREPQGFLFQLPALAKGVEQTGVYSHFAVAGDFEVSAAFELIAVSLPQKGYGVTCGIAVDTDGPGGTVSLARGYQMGNVNGYIVSQGKPSEAGMQYESTDFPSRAQKGVLAIRREKRELVCLTADRLGGELFELCRIPFTDATIRKVRVFADSGGSPTGLNARFADIKVQAEEITGGIPNRDRGGGWLGWLALAGVFIAGLIGFVVYRRRRGIDGQSEA
jgi:hypothetical protein